MNVKYLSLAFCASVALASPAYAAVEIGGFELDEGSFGAGFGVHSTGTQSGTTVDGIVKNDGSGVTFSSSVSLSLTGNGEATVLPVAGSITDLSVLLEKAWDNITFSFGGDLGTFSLLVNRTSLFDGGNCTICTIGKGQNKFILRGNGISSLDFNFNPGIKTARQFRVEGVSSVPAVPEPATWAMMLLGFGFVSGAVRSAKRQRKLAVSYI